MLPLGKVIAQGLSRETGWFGFEEWHDYLRNGRG